MGVYIPLRVRLTPASIPQVVAYIQTYLRDNPIPSIDTFADLIAEFLSDHPELVAVASVNGKTGANLLICSCFFTVSMGRPVPTMW